METHPFRIFIPPRPKYLILGSFTGKVTDSSYNWYYSNQRNQFWPILEQVYHLPLKTKKAKQKLFTDRKIATADVILSCRRKHKTNADNNLTNIVVNQKIDKLLTKYPIKRIYFTSCFTKKLFKKHFQTKVKLITLPSPSPRYAKLSLQQKIQQYRQSLPWLKHIPDRTKKDLRFFS